MLTEIYWTNEQTHLPPFMANWSSNDCCTACSDAKDFQYKVMQDVKIEKQYE